ncbi:hypothetical protein [uncultured Clostridium sp.]|uniref:hypothetical protein n=1 Tax=uncultured Clostridium sp. TaxID=59620 RepID=UPI0026DC800A|nr:hypothetical protein [uncultured Clostridium sp.]
MKERLQGKIVSFAENDDNSRFVKCKLKLMHDGQSKNRTQFTKETMVECVEATVRNTPILCHVYKDNDGNYKIGNHDVDYSFEQNEDDDFELVVNHLEKPVGFIPESTEIWCEEEDSRTYIYAYGLLWKHYMDKLNDILLDKDCISNISTELYCNDAEMTDDNILDIKKFELMGTTIISAETGMHNTVGEFYFSSEDTMTVEDMQIAYSEELRGGEKENMDENVKDQVVENAIEEQEPQVDDSLEETVVENADKKDKKDEKEEPEKDEEKTEEDDKKKKNELEEKYEELQAQFESLKQENIALNEKLESMKDYDELKEFKLQSDRAKFEQEVEEVTAKFGLAKEEISELKGKVLNYELELKAYEKELGYMYAMKKLAEQNEQTFSKKEEKKEEMPQIDDNGGSDDEPYGGLFNELLNK